MTIDELLGECLSAKDRFWFVQVYEIERTDLTITVRFVIGVGLFIQVFYSKYSGRLSLALIGVSGRLYGRDCEHGVWHRHPFDDPDQHELTPEGMSPQPVLQFLAEVEKILIENNLI